MSELPEAPPYIPTSEENRNAIIMIALWAAMFAVPPLWTNYLERTAKEHAERAKARGSTRGL